MLNLIPSSFILPKIFFKNKHEYRRYVLMSLFLPYILCYFFYLLLIYQVVLNEKNVCARFYLPRFSTKQGSIVDPPSAMRNVLGFDRKAGSAGIPVTLVSAKEKEEKKIIKLV